MNVPWVTPDTSKLNIITITLSEGDCLYLPSLWYHQVTQQGENLDGYRCAIAVNYWYDMDFSNPRYSYFQAMREMALLVKETSDFDEEI